jgi:hypothetical protein
MRDTASLWIHRASTILQIKREYYEKNDGFKIILLVFCQGQHGYGVIRSEPRELDGNTKH